MWQKKYKKKQEKTSYIPYQYLDNSIYSISVKRFPDKNIINIYKRYYGNQAGQKIKYKLNYKP